MLFVNIISLFNPYGGAQAVALDHINLQLKNNHRSILITSNRNDNFIRKFKGKNFRLVIIPGLHTKNIFKLALGFIKLFVTIINLKPDFVLSHSTLAGFQSRLLCKILKIKNIHTFHGFNTAKKFIVGYLYITIEKIFYLFNDITINVCKADFDYAVKQKFIKETEKAHVVYNSTNFNSKKEYPNFNFNNNLRFVMIARHSSQKDHITLFKAISLIKEYDFFVDLYGEGNLLEKNKQYAQELQIDDRVFFKGEVSNIKEIISSYDCSLLISNMEGFSISILESIAFGLPVIASDVGGVSEQVIDCHNGYLVPQKNFEFLAKRMKDLINDKETIKLFSKNSIKLFNDNFSIDSFENRVKKIIF